MLILIKIDSLRNVTNKPTQGIESGFKSVIFLVKYLHRFKFFKLWTVKNNMFLGLHQQPLLTGN